RQQPHQNWPTHVSAPSCVPCGPPLGDVRVVVVVVGGLVVRPAAVAPAAALPARRRPRPAAVPAVVPPAAAPALVPPAAAAPEAVLQQVSHLLALLRIERLVDLGQLHQDGPLDLLQDAVRAGEGVLHGPVVERLLLEGGGHVAPRLVLLVV